ncbi:MAG TPA: Holliday junction resolvase RuvX [Streptosporangiaceae bacterium]
MRSGIRLAIDVGSVRIGVAGCDPGGILATPMATVRRGAGDLAEIAELCAEREVIEVIVGLPTSLSGQAGRAAADARVFATQLADLIAPVGVRLVDERFTTTLAHSALRAGGRDSKQRRFTVDKAAAALLLQSALDSERLTGSPPGELVGAERGGIR